MKNILLMLQLLYLYNISKSKSFLYEKLLNFFFQLSNEQGDIIQGDIIVKKPQTYTTKKYLKTRFNKDHFVIDSYI